METRFAPPERTSLRDIRLLFKKVNKMPLIRELLDKSEDIMFILDVNRQVVFTNKAFMDFIGVSDYDQVIGKRPGEAFGCVHSGDVSGCGTTEFCIKCGAVNAILAAQDGEDARKECLLSVSGGRSFEFTVVAKPFEFGGHKLTFFTAKDISESKRRMALEKIFFHDIMNLACGIYSIVDLLQDGSIDDMPKEILSLLHNSSHDMVKEINEYRTILLAERRELRVVEALLTADNLVNDVANLYKAIAEAKGTKIVVKPTEDFSLRSDHTLLSRVLINMIKNAIEASSEGDVVTIWAEKTSSTANFYINNPAVIPQDIRTQIFKRTFTTKSSGSGLGTYSMKLLGESYLGGKVDFTSEEDSGTTFAFHLPLKD